MKKNVSKRIIISTFILGLVSSVIEEEATGQTITTAPTYYPTFQPTYTLPADQTISVSPGPTYYPTFQPTYTLRGPTYYPTYYPTFAPT
eukprot:CAMPEP_0194321408 /NCGR_PEP_ID=MMETSP0171-20130528/17632_1 /TAXON_ID=218684 /ORGANISM="Corethron pennatum, Strain L29A3" /LENGTH=88 /DNA_ID=CAMNT_0039079297 /DNA_START=49 /DNA_END=315 /DNA_ORIENTATION=+